MKLNLTAFTTPKLSFSMKDAPFPINSLTIDKNVAKMNSDNVSVVNSLQSHNASVVVFPD
jgi:hypothetical protein